MAAMPLLCQIARVWQRQSHTWIPRPQISYEKGIAQVSTPPSKKLYFSIEGGVYTNKEFRA